jgi:hypothetical protein
LGLRLGYLLGLFGLRRDWFSHWLLYACRVRTGCDGWFFLGSPHWRRYRLLGRLDLRRDGKHCLARQRGLLRNLRLRGWLRFGSLLGHRFKCRCDLGFRLCFHRSFAWRDRVWRQCWNGLSGLSSLFDLGLG